MSRVVLSFLPRLYSSSSGPAKGPLEPLSHPLPDILSPEANPRPIPPANVPFAIVATLSWGLVMYIFRHRGERLQPGIINSMREYRGPRGYHTTPSWAWLGPASHASLAAARPCRPCRERQGHLHIPCNANIQATCTATRRRGPTSRPSSGTTSRPRVAPRSVARTETRARSAEKKASKRRAPVSTGKPASPLPTYLTHNHHTAYSDTFTPLLFSSHFKSGSDNKGRDRTVS